MKAQSAPAPRGLAAATDAYRRARFERAAEVLDALLAGGGPHPDAALLSARVALKRGSPDVALKVLAAHARSIRARPQKTEAAMLRGVAFSRLGDPRSARAQFSAAHALLEPSDVLLAELRYHEAAAQWIERKLDAANATLAKIPSGAPQDVDILCRILRGAIAAARERYAEQGSILLDALRRIEASPGDVHLHAVIVTYVAALAVELPSGELRDAARDGVSRVAWTTDISDLHFHALRALAWRHALDGDEFNAFRCLKEAVNVTQSAAWRVAALTDRAYLALAFGEKRWAAQELRDAHELAASVDWNSVEGEEKLALPVLAELFAPSDAAVAVGYAATFERVAKSFARVLSSNKDRRVEALRAYCLGRVRAELGEDAEAKRLLNESWKLYERLGIAWRAGRAALGLLELTGDAVWRERAAASLRHYRRSWLARTEAVSRGVVAANSPALARLTPSQRAVFDLLMDGRSTAEIARVTERSVFTVRNHIKAIFKIFGVTSRPALIVKASGA